MRFFRKIIIYSFVFILVTTWIFSGWPVIHIVNIQFPPKIEIAKAAVGDIGIWRDSAGAQIPGTSFGALNFATQQRNDGDYTFTGSNTLELDAAGNYLLIGTLSFDDNSNGRVNYECQFSYTGSGNFQTVVGSGYSRNNNNDHAWCRTTAIVWGNAVDDTVQLQTRRDTDTPTGGSIANESHFQVVRLADSGAVGMYSDNSDTSSDGGTSWNEVPFNTAGYQSDTSSIELQTDDNLDIRLKKDATNYLIGYSVAYSNTGSRTQRVSRVETGSSGIQQSYGYEYCRQSSDEYCNPQGMFIYRNSGTSTDLTVQVQRGDAMIDGTVVRRTSTSGVWIVELPSSAEVFISHDSTGGQDVGGAAGDFNLFRTGDIDYNDAAAFTRSSDTAMNCEKDMDVLLMANAFAYDTTVANTRMTTGVRFEIQGTDATYGMQGNYLRNSQGSADTYNWGAVPAGLYAVSNGDDVQVEFWDEGDNGSTPNTVADKLGFAALNLDSLVPVGTLSVDIVDSGGSPVASPSMAMNAGAVSFDFQTTTGTFGTASEKVRVDNGTASPQWTLSVAASATTAVWDSAGTDYDFNDPTASAGDGGDADSVGGQLTVDPSVSTITPQG